MPHSSGLAQPGISGGGVQHHPAPADVGLGPEAAPRAGGPGAHGSFGAADPLRRHAAVAPVRLPASAIENLEPGTILRFDLSATARPSGGSAGSGFPRPKPVRQGRTSRGAHERNAGRRCMMRYIDCWTSVATALFSQALAGEPELVELRLPSTAAGAPMAATLCLGRNWLYRHRDRGRGRAVARSSSTRRILAASLAGEGMDQKAGWSELLREVAEAAAGELLAKTGRKCRIEGFEETVGESESPAREFHLKSHGGTWRLQVHDRLNARQFMRRERLNDAGPLRIQALFGDGRLSALLRGTPQG